MSRFYFKRSVHRPEKIVRSTTLPMIEAIEARRLLTTYYVSMTGADTNDGSSGAPWRTIKYASTHVAANLNHTIQVGAGTFTENGGFSLPAGVNLTGAGIDQTIITGTGGQGYDHSLIYLSSNFDNTTAQVLTGFTIDGNNKTLSSGLEIKQRNYVTVDHIKAINIGGGAIEFQGDYNAPPPSGKYMVGGIVRNCILNHCSNTNYYIQGNGARAYTDWWGAIALAADKGFQVYNNTIDNSNVTDGAGIKGFYAGGWHSGLQLYNNTIINAPKQAINPGETSEWGSTASIEMNNVTADCQVYGNTVNQWTSFPAGTKGTGTYSLNFHDNSVVIPAGGFAPEAIETPTNDADIHNNYFVNAAVGAINYAPSTSNILIHHNVFVGDGANGRACIGSGGTTNTNWQIYNNVIEQYNCAVSLANTISTLTFKNNVVQHLVFAASVINVNASATLTNIVIDHNLFFDYAAVRAGDQTIPITITNNVGSTPPGTNPGLNASGSKPDPWYRPSAATSAVVDAGVAIPGITDGYSGSAPDIGAYEFIATVPASPTGLGATASSPSQINLAWTDNSTNESGFKIERATDSAFTANLTLVTTTAANVTSYSDNGLNPSTTYYYRVRATNASGDSANSNTASATTQAVSGTLYKDAFVTGGGGYTAGAELNGQGPAVAGWSGAWTATVARYQPSATGLNAAFISGESGGSIVTTDSVTNATASATRTSTYTDALGGNGSAPVYISFLAKASTLSDGGVGGFAMGYVGKIVDFTRSGSTYKTQYAAAAGTLTDAGTFTTGADYLFVMKITPNGANWGASGNENLSYWIYNADAAAPSGTEPTAMYSASGVGNVVTSGGILATCTFSSKLGAMTFDELKVGSSWSNVVATTGLTSSGGKALPKRRPLSGEAIRREASEAIHRWALAGANVGRLNHVQIRVANLPNGLLGEFANDVITLDDDADGYGWYVDRQVRTDTEFAGHTGAPAGMDLLTVLLHEYGHALGISHDASENDVMHDGLGTGVRKNPVASDVLRGDSRHQWIATSKRGSLKSIHTPGKTVE